MGKFKNYYDAPEWKSVRRKVFQRDKYKCMQCSSRINLHCHHTYYIEGKEVWDYPLSCFQTICEKCHKEFHDRIKGRDMRTNPKIKSSKDRMIDRYVFNLSPKDRLLHQRYEELKNKKNTP